MRGREGGREGGREDHIREVHFLGKEREAQANGGGSHT